MGNQTGAALAARGGVLTLTLNRPERMYAMRVRDFMVSARHLEDVQDVPHRAARRGRQVHSTVFTGEHDAYLFSRRSRVSLALLGSRRAHLDATAAAVLD